MPRQACFPDGSGEHVVGPATPADGAAIARIVGAHEAGPPRDLLPAWWRRHREGFAVARGRAGAADWSCDPQSRGCAR